MQTQLTDLEVFQVSSSLSPHALLGLDEQVTYYIRCIYRFAIPVRCEDVTIEHIPVTPDKEESVSFHIHALCISDYIALRL